MTEVSSVAPQLTVSGVPSFRVRRTETDVKVKDGQTIVIGGLMEDRIVDSVRKVPGLGDIPLLGGLFTRTFQKNIKTELLIFLTPRVADQPADLQSISRDETSRIKAVREAGGPGAFEEHMESMTAGKKVKAEGGDDHDRP